MIGADRSLSSCSLVCVLSGRKPSVSCEGSLLSFFFRNNMLKLVLLLSLPIALMALTHSKCMYIDGSKK